MTAPGWWLIALMAAIMVADWAGVLMQAHLARRIEGARADLRAAMDASAAVQAERVAEIRRAAALCDEARRKCEVAKAAMDAATEALRRERGFGGEGPHPGPLHSAACGDGGRGQVVHLPVKTLRQVAAEAAGGE